MAEDSLQPFFVGNAPCAHVDLPAGTHFLHRCQLIKGAPRLAPGGPYSDMRWATKAELKELLADQPELGAVLRKAL